MKPTLTLLHKWPSTVNASQCSANMLPSPLHDVTIGQLLGDAGCSHSVLTHNSRLSWSFGAKQEEYALWIQSLYSGYYKTPLAVRLVKSTSDGPKIHASYRLKTLSLPVFNYYRDLFYVWDEVSGKYVKIIPANVLDWLSPIVLAHLVMGDGNYQSNAQTIRIYTNAFTREDLVRFASAVEAKYGIKVGVRHDRKGQYILAVGARNLVKFQELIKDHMHSSMLYRIGL